ncbi:DUF5327 family protein [Thalassorhabdus alkalitolerans]|uniref:DUF5327 family protein n=1 Tax=Thalassorhabdus alkalitolerans TaxID=2282697 RepID=A0ABW0YJN5_9BACI
MSRVNISAHTIIHKIQTEAARLQERGEDEQAIKEHARLIRAYCDLLLESEEETFSNHSLPPKNYQTIQKPLMSESQAVSPPKQNKPGETPSSEGSLLEF